MIQFDCHAHVYETVTAVADARYVPSAPAPLTAWLDLQSQYGLKGGVIVQVSFLGTDNSQLCAALSTLNPRRFAGVAVVPIDVSDTELDRLASLGIRGVRWNLVRNNQIPDLNAKEVQDLFTKLRARNLHLEIHLEGMRLAPVLPQLVDQGIRIVVDHFGLPSDPNPMLDPMIAATAGLSDATSLYFKFSGHYRTPFDVMGHAQEIRSKIGDHHIVWGSDWPHTQHEKETSFGAVQALCHAWGLRADGAAVSDLYDIRLNH
jgi:predicted TIM-barrel fold metal-dependent hydrolase